MRSSPGSRWPISISTITTPRRIRAPRRTRWRRSRRRPSTRAGGRITWRLCAAFGRTLSCSTISYTAGALNPISREHNRRHRKRKLQRNSDEKDPHTLRIDRDCVNRVHLAGDRKADSIRDVRRSAQSGSRNVDCGTEGLSRENRRDRRHRHRTVQGHGLLLLLPIRRRIRCESTCRRSRCAHR